MNENHIEIKVKHKNWLAKGILYLVIMICSLSFALLPYISKFASAASMLFLSIGGVIFVVFTVLFILLLYKECNPDNALILSAHGFIDLKHVGENIKIEWTNVSSVKQLGKKSLSFIGISLENSDIIIARMKTKEANEMRDNINENLPAILISQDEIRMPIEELNELLTKFVREARALENEVPKKPKKNPFSTDDVLRAFGQLPVEEVKPETEVQFAPVSEEKESDNDPFYESLLERASQSDNNTGDSVDKEFFTYTVPESDEVNDNISDEIQELLSRARSSKISELGKILNEKEIPYSAVRSKDNFESQSDDLILDTESAGINNPDTSADEITLESIMTIYDTEIETDDE